MSDVKPNPNPAPASGPAPTPAPAPEVKTPASTQAQPTGQTPPVKPKDLEPIKFGPPTAAKDDTPQTANNLDVPQTAGKPSTGGAKDDKPQTLHQKLAAIRDRVETAANSRVFEGKAEEFADAWADLDDIGTSDKPHEAAMIQAAHNHLQHYAPRRASELDSLEQQLDEATDDKPRPQAVPDSPQLAHVKQRIADLQTNIARDPRALPGDKDRAQQLQERVDQINTEKATAGAK